MKTNQSIHQRVQVLERFLFDIGGIYRFSSGILSQCVGVGIFGNAFVLGPLPARSFMTYDTKIRIRLRQCEAVYDYYTAKQCKTTK